MEKEEKKVFTGKTWREKKRKSCWNVEFFSHINLSAILFFFDLFFIFRAGSRVVDYLAEALPNKLFGGVIEILTWEHHFTNVVVFYFTCIIVEFWFFSYSCSSYFLFLKLLEAFKILKLRLLNVFWYFGEKN
jgi:hypothetical protein